MKIETIQRRFFDWLIDFSLTYHPDANGNITSYAEEELRLAGWYDEDAFYGDMMPKAVMRAARLFSIEGHSGMSAGIANSIISKVTMFKPLTPLTGKNNEWVEHDDGFFQNRRFPSVFKKGKDGQAYWLEGRVFEDSSGFRYTSGDSRVFIEFPWTPTNPEIVKVEATDE